MTATRIKSLLEAAVFTGVLCWLPNLTLADELEPSYVPDHAEAEAENATEDRVPGSNRDVPDHAQAQARGGDDKGSTTDLPITEGKPTHAEAQARGGSQ